MSSSSEVEQARRGVWIRVAEPVRLRDYFLRLGAHAKIVDDAGHLIVLVESADLEIEAYLDSWAAINQTAVSTTKKPAPSVPRLGARSVTRPRLGDLLLSKGMITDLQLKEALAESFAAGDLLGRVLLRRRWLFEDELARTLAEQLHLPYVNIRHTGFDMAVARLLPFETGMRFAAIPVCLLGDRARVAFADPCDEPAQQAVAAHLAGFECVVAELSDIEQAWQTLHRNFGP
jgi:hypothetical protein